MGDLDELEKAGDRPEASTSNDLNVINMPRSGGKGNAKGPPPEVTTKEQNELLNAVVARPTPKKGKGGILHMRMADAFRFNSKSNLPNPAIDLRVYEGPTKEDPKVIFSVDKNNVAKERSLAFVVNEMVTYRRQHLEYDPSFCDWTISDLRDCAKMWLAETALSPKPRPFGFKDETDICFQRLDFHIDTKLKRQILSLRGTPKWDELMSRMSNSRAVKAFIGSILLEESYLQQYLYIYGEGGDGKGALVRALKKVMGAAAYTKQRGPRIDDKHYGVSFANKRLVAFTDSLDPAVVRADYVMALTGDDGLEVEPKHGQGFNIPPYCKLIFLSNFEPRLVNKQSEIRRLIYATVTPRECGPNGLIVDDPAGYEDGLWEEIEDFLKHCLNVYHEECPKHGMIPQSAAAVKAIAKLTEGKETDNYEEFFHDNFVLDLPEGKERLDQKGFVLVKRFNELLRREWKDSKKRTLFKQWLAAEYKIVTKGGGVPKRFGENTERVLYGLYAI